MLDARAWFTRRKRMAERQSRALKAPRQVKSVGWPLPRSGQILCVVSYGDLRFGVAELFDDVSRLCTFPFLPTEMNDHFSVFSGKSYW